MAADRAMLARWPPSRSRARVAAGSIAGATLDLRFARPVGRPPATVAEEGYTEPTPVQAAAIPLVLAGPRRPRGGPDRHRQDRRLRAADPRPAARRTPTRASRRPATRSASLILVPTRELAIQVDESVRTYGRTVPLRSTVVYGGVPMEPADQGAARRRRDPRRDARPAARPRRPAASRTSARSRSSSSTRPTGCSTWASCPTSSRSSRCSRRSARTCCSRRRSRTTSGACPATILRDPATVEVAPRNTAAEAVRQLVYPVDRDRKEELLAHLIREDDLRQVLVFTRTKLAATRLADAARPRRASTRSRSTRDRSQPERTRALEGFKTRRDPGPRRDRRRGARPRHRGPAGRRQLRAAVEPAGLHPPHRPDRPRRGDGRGDLARLHRRGRPAARRPADAQAGDPVDGRGRLRPRPRHGAATARRAGQAARASRTASRPPQAGPPPGVSREWPASLRLPGRPVPGRSSPLRRAPGRASSRHPAVPAGATVSTTAPGKKNPSMRSASTRSTV